MLRMIDQFAPLFESRGAEITTPEVVQTLTEERLSALVPAHDGWIIGDDPATRAVFEAGKAGRLKAAVKWGIGVDNVDFAACKDLDIPITNTPNMFGTEVADLALGYVIALARETFQIDAGVRRGEWPKPSGISLGGKTVALVGLGDIGSNVAKRLSACDMNIIAYDPFASEAPEYVDRANWPDRFDEADFLVITCALTDSSHHMVNSETLATAKSGLRVVNVGRGPVIDEPALESALETGIVYSAALDVFEQEPLPEKSVLRLHERCVFGSHNASNTQEAVERTSLAAANALFNFLDRIA
ncbi:MAG: phosphoglycerate dehydrogenase [Pseudomonadota bacterium]